MDDLELVKKRSEKARKDHLKRVMQKYHYAKDNGLSSDEARQIMNWGLKRIDQYIEDRKKRERI